MLDRMARICYLADAIENNDKLPFLYRWNNARQYLGIWVVCLLVGMSLSRQLLNCCTYCNDSVDVHRSSPASDRVESILHSKLGALLTH